MAKWGPENLAKARAPRKQKLTPKERKLAINLVQGMPKTQAMQKAGFSGRVNVKEGDPDSVFQRPHFVKFMRELQDRQIKRLDYSVDNLCARLEFVYLEAIQRHQYGPAVQAALGIAKMMGHLADRTEIEMHIISKPLREPTEVVTLSPEEWQRQFSPRRIN